MNRKWTMARVSRRRGSWGFTLVELLVVIAIIGVLVALLLPAVQAAREAARRMQCQNNLKQMALAAHNHHDTYLYFPNAGSDGPTRTCCNADDRRGWSWAFQLLPFIEQQNVFDQTSDAVVNLAAIKSHYCPTRRPPAKYGSSAKNDYAANGGNVIGEYGKEGCFIRQWATVSTTTPLSTPVDQQRRMADLLDGTSQTLMIGEKQVHPTTWGTAGGDNEPWNNAGWDECIVRFGSETPQPDHLHPDSTQPTFWSRRFGSTHPGGVNVARADGSVINVTFSVDATVWKNFCTIRDGNILNGPF
ncbi:DUF1559 domain-containing protein [Anatilimnocola floriformis]|uniref:DUF1559 domain-containing protein n=1 Tax=Anatilimnocola floriformis TaxID=2948575 RepID=UPI0020C2D19C|nr:DUF1559 domain-containing protein [Anatilimnocola floriformis]